MRIRLHHAHLPRFADAGVVALEDDGERLELTPTGQWLDRVREDIDDLLDGERV